MPRQLRLGDTLDDYCPRERRLTNHAVVALVGPDVKQVRCTTCDTEHEYKHAKVPRQRKKSDAPAALYAQVLAGGPKRVVPDTAPPLERPGDPAGPGAIQVGHATADDHDVGRPGADRVAAERAVAAALGVDLGDETTAGDGAATEGASESHNDLAIAPPGGSAGSAGSAGSDDGFVHRRLIRAQLPRGEGQPPPARPAPDFTIRQPAGRPGRFRPRAPGAGPGHGAQGPQGSRGGQGGHGFGGRGGNAAGGGPMRSGSRAHGGPHPMNARPPKRHDSGRKRSR